MLVTNMSTMSRPDETKRRLQEEAIRLFSSRGFDNVTVEEVARAAGVSHMTFFRYFPTKESVVMDDPYDPLLAEAITAQDASLAPLELLRRGVLHAFAQVEEPADKLTRTRIELAEGHPSLRARIWENNQRTGTAIVEALVEAGASKLEATVAAGAVLGALTAALFDWAQDEAAGSLGERIRTAMRLLAADGEEAVS